VHDDADRVPTEDEPDDDELEEFDDDELEELDDTIEAIEPAAAADANAGNTIDPAATVHCTILENPNGDRLVKAFAASEDGHSFIEGPAPRQEPQALARDIDLGSDEDKEMLVLRDTLCGVRTNQCFIAAAMPPGSAPTRSVIYARAWAALPEDRRALDGAGPLARNATCFAYPAGPAAIGLDIDAKGMPAPELQKLKAAGGPLVLLQTIDPQLKTAGLCVRLSASAKLIDRRTRHRQAGSMHVFLVVQDAADAERWLNTLSAHFILRGHAWIRIAKDGKMELRTPLDLVASGKPERWWFEGTPCWFDAGHGKHLALTQNAQDWAQAGPRVDTTLLPDLTSDQRRDCAATIDVLMEAARPEADMVRQEYAERKVTLGMAAGLTREEAQARAAEEIEGGRLHVDGSYLFDDGTWRSGEDILANVAAVAGMTGGDPLEPDYGGGHNRAIWFTRAGNPGIFCNSRAHHGREFHLAYGAPELIALASRLTGTAEERRAAYAEAGCHYLPIDTVDADALLRQHGLPAFGLALDFADLSGDALSALLEAEDWAALAALRRDCGTFFDQAIDELPQVQAMDIDARLAFNAAVAADAVANRSRDKDKDGAAHGTDGTDAGIDDDTDPIVPQMVPQAPYPIDALPGLFGEAVRAVARINEVGFSMAGTIALAAASTAVCKLVRGVEFNGQVKPGSLATANINDSSERKTATDNETFAGIREVERELVAEYREDMRQFEAEMRVHERAVNHILGLRGAAARAGIDPSDQQRQTYDLLQLKEPEPPKKPHLITADPTVEGLRDLLAQGHGLIGVASPDGGIVLAGHSLGRAEGKAAAGAFHSMLWDGQDITITRANDRVISLQNPRVSMSLGVQPRIAQRFLQDDDLRDQGLVNRFLVTWPTPKSGHRTFAPTTRSDRAVMDQFNKRCADRLRQALVIGTGQFATEHPRDTAVPLSRAADTVWRAFALEMDAAQRKGGTFEFTRGMAGKAAEQAARIALVFQLFEDADAIAVEVEEWAMQAGVIVARWYAHEWLRLTSVPKVPRLNQTAERVLDWAKRTYPNGQFFSARHVYTARAGGVTTPEAADRVLSLLARFGHIERCGEIPRKGSGRPPLPRYRFRSVV
jgi:hypothetical protein